MHAPERPPTADGAGSACARGPVFSRAILRGIGQRLRQQFVPGRTRQQGRVIGAQQLRHRPPDLALAENAGRDFCVGAVGHTSHAAFVRNEFGQRGAQRDIGHGCLGFRIHVAVPVDDAVAQRRGRAVDGKIANPVAEFDRDDADGIAMDRRHVLHRRLLKFGEALPDTAGAMRRHAVGAKIMFAVFHHAVVGGDDGLLDRIDAARHLLERNQAVPFVLAGPARHRQPAIGARAHRHFRAHAVADAAGRVGGDEVVIHQAPFAAGVVQFLDRRGSQHRQRAVERRIRQRELHRAQHQAGARCGIARDDRTHASFRRRRW